MDFKLSNKVLVVLVIVLIAICTAQGFFIYRHVHMANQGISDQNFDSFSSKLKNQMNHDKNTTWDMYDHFFNDDFFAVNKDPFTEMENLRKRMNDMMEKEMKATFDNSWNSWFGNRFLGGENDMDIQISEKDNTYIITLNIPNLKDNNLNVTVDQDGISIKGDYVRKAVRKDPQGRITSQDDIEKSMSRRFSIPHDADYHHAKISKHGDEIIITLQKRMKS